MNDPRVFTHRSVTLLYSVKGAAEYAIELNQQIQVQDQVLIAVLTFPDIFDEDVESSSSRCVIFWRYWLLIKGTKPDGYHSILHNRSPALIRCPRRMRWDLQRLVGP